MIGCCIPGCTATGMTLHRFPNPKKRPELFNRWLEVINLPSLRNMTLEQVYQNRRICFAHFDAKYKSPGNPRIHLDAIPSIGLPGSTLQIQKISTVSHNSKNTVDTAEDHPSMSMSILPSPGPSGLSNITTLSHQDPVSCKEGGDNRSNIFKTVEED